MADTVAPRLDGLPDDVLGPILSQLSISDLISLRAVGRGLCSRIDCLGIPLYLSSKRVAHTTLYPSPSSSSSSRDTRHDQWDPLSLVRYNHHIDRSLADHRWHAVQIGKTWSTAVIPALHLSSDRLIIGVGGKIISHPLLPPNANRRGERVVHRPREYPLTRPGSNSGTRSDVVGIVDLHDSQGSLAVAQFDGSVQRLILPESGASVPRITARYPKPQLQDAGTGVSAGIGGAGSIQTFTGNEDGSLTLSTLASGHAVLHQMKSPWLEPTSIALSSKSPRAWSSLLSTTHRHAMLGVSGSINIHPLRSTGLDIVPTRKLHGPDLPLTSSPYDITYAPEGSSHNPNLLLSAWYDSHLRLHDLRERSHSSSSSLIVCTSNHDGTASNDSGITSATNTFMDPYTWADGSAFYSCTFVGSHHVAGGCARHGTVAIFDIRQPRKGWSTFSPGGKGSPVYSLKGDGGRLWGVTEKRAFVLAFDGSGEIHEGLVHSDARADVGLSARMKGREVPSGWKGRGGKWGWTVRYDQTLSESSTTVGYEHRDRGVELFNSLAVV